MKIVNNSITDLFGIQYPIVQGGMVWCSGWRLASAVSEAGGLGLIGSGSMRPELLREHVQKCRASTRNPFGVNVPLHYPEVEALMDVIIQENVPVVFTSAGSPSRWTSHLQSKGIKVAHVVSSVKFALKCEAAGVDALVAEGFEAGGHNGREETTTFCLVPQIREAVSLPLLAAGGIGSGRGMLAAMVLGADGVQIGSLFAASEESSAHAKFKEKVVGAAEGDTVLSLKRLTPVRLLKNHFYEQVRAAEERGADVEELREILGKRRAKRGIFEGELDEGELEIGQVAAQVRAVKPAALIIREIWEEYLQVKEGICTGGF